MIEQQEIRRVTMFCVRCNHHSTAELNGTQGGLSDAFGDWGRIHISNVSHLYRPLEERSLEHLCPKCFTALKEFWDEP